MKVLLLTRYGERGASSRLRTLQYLPALKEAGIVVDTHCLISDDILQAKYRSGGYEAKSLIKAYLQRTRRLLGAHNYDLIWIEKEALPWLPVQFERLLLSRVPYLLDFDDAIFHNYDLSPSWVVRTLLGTRIDVLMRGSRSVIAGNDYLATRAISSGATAVHILPTVVDIYRYPAKEFPQESAKPRIVWIGSPSTVSYLRDLEGLFIEINAIVPFVLRIIGGTGIRPQGVEIEEIPWTLDSEGENIRSCDIGIMPLRNTPWELGKCAYKIVQYMAAGLPSVASAIGANNKVIVHGHTGYLSSNLDEWRLHLLTLLRTPSLRQSLGENARVLAERRYSLQSNSASLVEIIRGSCK